MKFNRSAKENGTTTNYMGAKAYVMSAEMELYTAVATCVVDDAYYEKAAARLERIRSLVSRCPATFTARLAVYARKELNLRSIPVLLAVELARVHAGDNLVSNVIRNIVLRADEIKEVLACYQLSNSREATKKLNRLSKQVQKGLAQAFNRFDEYQFAKYNTASEIKLKDALFLVHPKAKDEAQQQLFNKIATGTLATPYTWETELSALGKQHFATQAARAMAFTETWDALVLSKRLGYMALLRNLRNLVYYSSTVAFTQALAQLTSEQQINASRQLPFRYLSAFKELETIQQQKGVPKLLQQKAKQAMVALEQALVTSCANIPVQRGTTVILSDNSGSMFGDLGGKSLVSAMSKRTTADIANLFAVLYWNQSPGAYIGLFGDKLVNPQLSRKERVFENFTRINEAAKNCGPATERGIFDYMSQLIRTQQIVDRIIIFSDCQVGQGCKWFDHAGNRGDNFNQLLVQYRLINPGVKVYSIDLKGYGNTMVEQGAVLVSGWNERIFDMIAAVEAGQGVVETINAIDLG
ncbi:TROVE domain-containing protein [Taibaiella chishuiensis]|uniref:TROVE domain-containing protein n=1 Tax=Taibaiella chishuiensis TaxID=1434707 RepID=A0A2P8DAV0_9BACT|nr:TROVE domain-containing protein [Taibaiella chishuiensis]PSK94343.1 TROVE domain-containing protein [Taibaiella chishuiensis]